MIPGWDMLGMILEWDMVLELDILRQASPV